MTSLPALFSGSGQTVVEGSVIWLYCEASSISPTLTVTWKKDNTEIVEDVPRICTRRSTSGSSTTFLLGVDNLQVSDGGTYQCSVQDGADTVTGDIISLTGNVNQLRQCIECIKISCIVQYLQQWLDHFSLFLSLLHLSSCSEVDQQLDMLLGRQPLLTMRLASCW